MEQKERAEDQLNKPPKNISQIQIGLNQELRLLATNALGFRELASQLAKNVELGNYLKWGRPGIRAQFLNIRQKKLEMDFILEGDENSTHILNAVSPTFTSALPFAKYIVLEMMESLKNW